MFDSPSASAHVGLLTQFRQLESLHEYTVSNPETVVQPRRSASPSLAVQRTPSTAILGDKKGGQSKELERQPGSKGGAVVVGETVVSTAVGATVAGALVIVVVTCGQDCCTHCIKTESYPGNMPHTPIKS